MGGFSNYEENKILDHVFKGTALAQHTNLYIGLFGSTIDDTHTGTSAPNEVSGGNYARVICNTWDAAASGATENSQVETFAQATAPWGTVTDFAVMTHSTTGQIVVYGKLTTSKKIATDDTAKFATGDIDVTLT